MKGNAEDKVIVGYITEVGSKIRCKKSVKDKYLIGLRYDVEEAVDGYIDKNTTEITMPIVVKAYGSADETADKFYESDEYQAVKKVIEARNSVFRLILSFCIIAILCFGAFLLTRILQGEDIRDGRVIEVLYENVNGTPPPESDENAHIY